MKGSAMIKWLVGGVIVLHLGALVWVASLVLI